MRPGHGRGGPCFWARNGLLNPGHPRLGTTFKISVNQALPTLESREERTLQITGSTRETDRKLPSFPAIPDWGFTCTPSTGLTSLLIPGGHSMVMEPSTVTVDTRLLSAPCCPSLKSIFSPRALGMRLELRLELLRKEKRLSSCKPQQSHIISSCHRQTGHGESTHPSHVPEGFHGTVRAEAWEGGFGLPVLPPFIWLGYHQFSKTHKF